MPYSRVSLFPGLFTAMKLTRRVQTLTCISRPHLPTKTCSWKASLCSGTSSPRCCALAVNLHPLQRSDGQSLFSQSSKGKTQVPNTPPILVLQETEPKLSPSWNPKIICEPHPQFTEPLYSAAPFEPVQVGNLGGKMEISLTLKSNLAMPGAKVRRSPSGQHSALSGVSVMNH